MRKVPKKNIGKSIADIVRAGVAAAEPEKSSAQADFLQTYERIRIGTHTGTAERFPVRKFLLVFCAIAAIAGVVMFIRAQEAKEEFLSIAASEFDDIKDIVPDIREFRFEEAQKKIEEGIGRIDREFGIRADTGFGDWGKVIGAIPFLFRDAGQMYTGLQGVSGEALGLLAALDELQRSLPLLVFGERKADMLPLLERIEKHLVSMRAGAQAFASLGERSLLGDPGVGETYLATRVELERFADFASRLVAWARGEKDIAVLFYNDSELRPGGGFLGSYAHVRVKDGSVDSYSIHDVNEPDRAIARTIVPPKPLQAIAKQWRAADANWFFDFPTSAEKTLALLESSEMYRASGTVFAGAIAVSPRLIEDILALTGPVYLERAERTIDHRNFIEAIQEEVQNARGAGESAPKAILGELAPLLLARLAESAGSGRGISFTAMRAWVERKDAMIYLRDSDLESAITRIGGAGAMFELPGGKGGDVLGIAHANIGGGKTDRVIDTAVSVENAVSEDGVVQNTVRVQRVHRGDEADAWWYKVPNRNYIKLYVPQGAELTYASGTVMRNIPVNAAYAKGGYENDPDVAAIESSTQTLFGDPTTFIMAESGKTVFSGWVVTDIGETSEALFGYARRMPEPPRDGALYTFTFERQAGARGSYRFEIAAPPGFVWEENGAPVYEYETDDAPGRLQISLTFAKVVSH